MTDLNPVDAMTTDYRALCAELVELSAPVDSIPQLAERLQKLNQLADRARTLLAQPVAEGPTDEELLASVRHFYGDQTAADMGAKDDLRTARAVLARWGRPPSLKEQALKLIETYECPGGVKLTLEQCDTIRRALEALDD